MIQAPIAAPLIEVEMPQEEVQAVEEEEIVEPIIRQPTKLTWKKVVKYMDEENCNYLTEYNHEKARLTEKSLGQSVQLSIQQKNLAARESP